MPTQYIEDQNRRRRCPYAAQVETVRQYSMFDKFMTGAFILSIGALDIILLGMTIPICFNSTLEFCDLALFVFAVVLLPIGVSMIGISCAFNEIKQWTEKV